MRRPVLTFLAPILLLLGIAVAHAGSLTPPASPAATSYTLGDIYGRLTTNEEADEADHPFAPSGSPAASLYTLTQIYDAIPTIDETKVLSGTTYLGIAGTITDREGDTASTAQAAAGGINYLTAPTGFYDGDDRISATDAQVAALDGDITAANIADGITIFGVEGTLAAGTDLSDMWNGTSGSFTGGTLEFGGIDDYNNGGAPPVDRYSATWTTCDSGNSYCGTGDSGAALKDENTGLVWSKTMNSTTYALDDSAGTMTWFKAYNCNETTGSFCTKKTSSKTGCEANTGWYLPHQKQLMQAWIDGAYGNLEPSGSTRLHWSATTGSTSATNAWRVTLGQGVVGTTTKTNTSVVRCVRPA